jgi:ribonuclease P protein component
MQPSESIGRLESARDKLYGFSRDKRLLTGKDYKQVFEQAKRIGNPHWTVYGWRHQQPKAQLGLAIAKKTLRRAHERNRLKRLARETFRHMHGQLSGVNIVVMAGKAAETADNATLVAQLTKLFNYFLPKSQSINAPSSTQSQKRLIASEKSSHRIAS